jgi:uncharacterized protein (DUF697 family)
VADQEALAEARPESIERALDWAYGQALQGVGGVASVTGLANEFLMTEGTLDRRVDRLIRWQSAKSGLSGFATGVGGLPALPVTLPLSLTSVLFVQLRMIAAIAHMGGHDVRSERVKTLAFACLLGNAAKDVMKEAGVQVGAALTRHAIARISQDALDRLNRRVGFILISKFGPGMVRLARLAPLVGGVVGATFDGVSTYAVGRVAQRTFVDTVGSAEAD